MLAAAVESAASQVPASIKLAWLDSCGIKVGRKDVATASINFPLIKHLVASVLLQKGVSVDCAWLEYLIPLLVVTCHIFLQRIPEEGDNCDEDESLSPKVNDKFQFQLSD